MTKPTLAQDSDDGRMYIHPGTCRWVPSVTTIMKAGLPKPALVGWAARMSAEYAVKHWNELGTKPVSERVILIKTAHEEIRDTAADIGDQVHDVIDSWNTGVGGKIWPKDSYANQFIAFLNALQPRFLESEVTLWSEKHGYAGTCDWIAEIDGYCFLGDTKSGRGIYPEVGLQLAALSHADFILRPDGTEDQLPPITHLGVLHIRPRSWKFIQVREGEENFKAFLACKQIFDWNRNIAPEVLGDKWPYE